jgi:hypothetical protein
LEKTFVKCCWCARLLRMDALPAHGYLPWLTGAHGNERNAGGLCIAAGSSGLARAQAMLTGEMYRTHALSGTTEWRAWRDARCGLCAALCKQASSRNRKELITDHLTNVQSGRPVRARSHCAGSTHTAGGRAEPPWLQCKSADRACAVRAVCAGRRARAPT